MFEYIYDVMIILIDSTFLLYENTFLFSISILCLIIWFYKSTVTALANKKFPEDEDCTTYGRLTSELFSVQSKTLNSASDFLSNQDSSIISDNASNEEPSLEEKMWSAMALDSPTQPLPLVQKRENFYYWSSSFIINNIHTIFNKRLDKMYDTSENSKLQEM